MPSSSSSNSGALGSNSAYRGLRSSEAAERLSNTLRGVLADDARRIELEEAREFGDVLFRQLSAAHNVIMVISALLLFAGYAYGADAKSTAIESSYLISGLVVIAGVALNIILVLMRLHRLRWEVHYRMTDVLLEYERVALSGGAVMASAVYASATALAFAKAVEPDDQSSLPSLISSAQVLSAAAAGAGAVVTDDGVVAGIMHSSWESLEFHEPINATHALPVFRDGDWIRLPVSLLVKGDLIALTTKEIPPAKFDERDGRLLGRRGSSLRSYLESPSGYTAGSTVHSVTPKSAGPVAVPNASASMSTSSSESASTVPKSSSVLDDTKMRVRENDIDAVTLVGDLRRYVLRDTVARAALQRRLRVQPKPQPLLMWELRSFSRLASMWQIGLAVLAIVVVIIRSLITNCVPNGDLSSRNDSSNCRNGGYIGLLAGLLYQIPALLLCLSPVSLPLMLLIVEAYSTARLLAFHEAVLVRNKWKEWKKRLMLDIFYAQRKQNLESTASQGKSSDTNSSSSSSSSDSFSQQQLGAEDTGSLARPSKPTGLLCCSCLRKISFSWNILMRPSPNTTAATDGDVLKHRPIESSEEDPASIFITEGDASGNIPSSNAPTPRARRQLPSESPLDTKKRDPISVSDQTQGRRPEIRRGAELWALLAGGNLNAQLFAANSDNGSGNPAPLPFWNNNNDGSDSDDSSSDESEADESDDPFVSNKRGKSQNHDRLASDMWMPEKKKGTSLNRLLRVLQKGPVFNEVQGHSNALAELRQIRPDVGGLDSRGEIIPIQYLGSTATSAFDPNNSPISVLTQSQGASSLPETDPLAIAHKASSISRRKFDGPTFSHISRRSWKDVRASRILFYLRRILRVQGQSVVQPSPIPARHSSVSNAGFIERLIGSLHACFQRCCSRPVSAEEATLQRWKNAVLRDDLIDIGFGLRPVQTPLLSSQLMARLGVITTFCCSDKNTVCESEPTVENVMLLKGQTGSVFIDLHADETSPTGIRFDDKNWKNHISALKPVGLACLVNARQVDSEIAASGAWKSAAPASSMNATTELELEDSASPISPSQTEVKSNLNETEAKSIEGKSKDLKNKEEAAVIENQAAVAAIAVLSDTVDIVPKSSRERRSRRLHTRRQLVVSGDSGRPESPGGDANSSSRSQRLASRQSQVKPSKSLRSQRRRKQSDDMSGSGTERQDLSNRTRGGSFVDEPRRSRKKRLDSNNSYEDMMTRKMQSRARSASGSEASSDKSYMHRGQSSPSRRMRANEAREDGNDDNDDAQSVQSDYSMGRNEDVGGTPAVDMRRSFRRLSRELSRDNDDSGFGSGFDDSESNEDSDIYDSEGGNRSRNMSMDGGASEDGNQRPSNTRRSRRVLTKGGTGGRESASSSRLGSSQNRSAAVSAYSSEVDSDHFGEEEGFSDRDDKSADRVSDDRRNDIRHHKADDNDASPTNDNQSSEQHKESLESDDNAEEDEEEEADELDDDEEFEDLDDDDDDDDEEEADEDDEDEDDEEEDDVDDEDEEEEYGDDFVVARSHHRRKVRLDVVKEEENIDDSENEDEADEEEEEEEVEIEDGEKPESLKINQLIRSHSVPDRLDAKKSSSGDRSPSRVPRVLSDQDFRSQPESKWSAESKSAVRKDDGPGYGSTTSSVPPMNLTFAIANAIRMPNLPTLASLGSLAFQPARYSSPEGQRNSDNTTSNASASHSIVSLVPHIPQGQSKGGVQPVPLRTIKTNAAALSMQNQNQRQQQLQRQQTLLLEQQNFLRRQRVVLALQQQILQRRAKSGATVGSGKKIDVNKLLVILSKELAADDDRSLHKLAQAVKRVPPRSYLCSLAREIGFTEFDESQFQHVRHIHTIGVSSLPARPPGHPAALGVLHRGPRVKPVRTVAHALQPAISATVVRDIRRNTLETLTQGNVPYLLSNCDMYWDGRDVLSFSKGRREALLSTFQQWQSEDLVCVGLAFDPVSREEGEVLRLIEAAYIQSTLSRAHSPELLEQNTMFQPVDIGLGFDAANLFLMARDLKLNAQMDARKPASSPHGSSEISPSAVSSVVVEPVVDAAISPVTPLGGLSESAAKKLAQMCEAKLLRMQSSQIFVGMVAARYLPQPKMQTLIKDLDGAGVRFTYMANRNYRQTKPLATKMGLETGWNCAISLMPRKQRRNRLIDGGELSASHAAAVENTGVGGGEEAAGGGGQGGLGDFEVEDEDELEFGVEGILTEEQRKRRIRGEIDEQRWDMKAQLPHGIPEIRTHLKEKDNVPLLVSLFTDSTPASIAGMIRIMQENGEQVLVVCSSLRKSTPLLFNVADLGVAIEPPFDGLQRDSKSDRIGVNVKAVRLSEIADAAGLTTNGRLEEQTMSSAPTSSSSRGREKALPLSPQHPNLRFSSAFTSLHASLSLPAGASLHLLLKTITESRRILEEARQTLLFLSASHLLLALIIVVNICTAMPQVLPIHHLLWLSWVIIPLVALPLLAAPPNNDVKHGSNENPDSTGGDLISMPEKRPLNAMAKDGTMHVWDILPGPEAPSLTEQEAAHYASHESGLQNDLGGDPGSVSQTLGIASEVEIAVLPRGDEVTDVISNEEVHVQIESDAAVADLQGDLVSAETFEDREEMLVDVDASQRGEDQRLSRTDGTAKSEGHPFSEGVHTIEGIDELFLNDAETRNDENGLHVGGGDEDNEALRSEHHERRRIESISKHESIGLDSGGTGDDEVLLPVIFSADEEGGDDDVKHQLRLRSVEEGLRMGDSAEDGVPSAAELELVLGLDKDTLSPSTLGQSLLFSSPVGFISNSGQESDTDNISNQPQSELNTGTDAQNDLVELGIIDSDIRVDVVEEENTENLIASAAAEGDVGAVDSALDQRAETVMPIVDSDGVVLDVISGEGVKERPGKARVPRSVSKGPAKAGKRTQKGIIGTALSQISASSSSSSSSASSSSANAIPGFDAKTGGVRAEALIKYAAYNDVTSILSGNILDLTDVSAKHAAVRLKNRGAQTGGALTAADAAAELDFAMGIPPVQGLVASSPPPTPLPRSWRTLTLYAALSLLPAACIHEYLFERSMAVCFQLQDGGWISERDEGGSYPLFFPNHLIPNNINAVKSCIASAQSFVLLSLVVWIVISSSLFAHRALSWRITNPLKNKAWIVGCGLAIILQLIYSHILTAAEGASSIFSTQPWDLWIVGLGYQGVSFCILWVIRRHDAKQLQRERKMSRLLFDTRLGMYSPR